MENINVELSAGPLYALTLIDLLSFTTHPAGAVTEE